MQDLRFETHVCRSVKDVEATEKDLLYVLDGLSRNIIKHLGEVELGITIRVFLCGGQDRTVGGISGNAFGGWIYTSFLWVDEEYRNRGYGGGLLARLENEASRLGCRNAHVDTYSFEAVAFYLKAGYTVFGELEDYPPGFSKVFLRKHLG